MKNENSGNSMRVISTAMKLALSICAAVVLAACSHPVRVLDGEDDRSVVAAIERYQEIGAPGGRERHEVATGVAALDHASALASFKRATGKLAELSDLRGALQKAPVGRTKTGYFYTVATSPKHVFLVFAREKTDVVVWVALM